MSENELTPEKVQELLKNAPKKQWGATLIPSVGNSVTVSLLPRTEIAMHILAAVVGTRSTYYMQERDVRVAVEYADALIKELEK